jgi:hypothetical protein
MIAYVRKYIKKTGKSRQTVDEVVVTKTDTKIVGELYNRIKFRELPVV